jgi:mannosyl-oligosaccharide alpha-1,2-mannosidase
MRSFLVTLSFAFFTLIDAALIQKEGLKLPHGAAANAKLVRDTFSSAYNDYKTHAYGHDDLAPVSGGWV